MHLPIGAIVWLIVILTNSLGFGCCPFYVYGSVVVDLLSIVAPDVCWGFIFGPCFCNAVLYVLSSLQS